MEVWQIIAIPLVSALTGLITTGVVMTVGGWGVLASMSRRLLLLQEAIDDTNTRITKEVKVRAAAAAVESKKGTPEEQAKAFLSQDHQRSARPTVVA